MDSIVCPKRFYFLFLSVYGIISGYAQDQVVFKNEISFSSANDAYVIWQNSDRFYSYGLGLHLKFKAEKILGLQDFFTTKEDYFFEAGLRLEGYTPTNKIVSETERLQNQIQFDRPYAGLLYATFQVTYAFERSFFRAGGLLGILGPSSLAGDFQGWFHDKITDDPVFDEWRYQVPDQPVINFNAQIGYDFLPQQKWFDVFGTLDTRLGNLYMDATPTFGIRLGKFKPLSRSVGTDNNILSNASGIELFLQSSISGTAHIFDATAQGNLFRDDFEYGVENLNTFSSVMIHSVYFATKRFSFGIEHYFTFGRVLANERHVYARSFLKYKF